MIAHLLFEQSGVFKNAFKDLGFNAFDYDICNDFNQTDFIFDLFVEIEYAYSNKPSIFDKIKSDDIIIAFFPCVRFTFRNTINYKRLKCNNYSFSFNDCLLNNMSLFNETNTYYQLLNKLVYVCYNRGLRLIIENPYNKNSILSLFWFIQPTIVDFNRSLSGDSFVKPTSYYFINFEPTYNFNFDVIDVCDVNSINDTHNKVKRSLISYNYAYRFITTYLI